ncbi:hypothetical protein [Bacillus sp. JJ722]|uniref:hypothetical protein n=1 Tax=Bacillus sp. JJ722 TaxID=3122973 RepID=UPI003000C10A
MRLLEAIRASSNAGKRYTPAELAAKMLGEHAAMFRCCGTTEAERKGRWEIDEQQSR